LNVRILLAVDQVELEQALGQVLQAHQVLVLPLYRRVIPMPLLGLPCLLDTLLDLTEHLGLKM